MVTAKIAIRSFSVDAEDVAEQRGVEAARERAVVADERDAEGEAGGRDDADRSVGGDELRAGGSSALISSAERKPQRLAPT